MSGGTDYTYDDKGQFFPYFVLTISALVTLPVTYSLLKPSKELENTAPRIQTDFKPEQADLIEKQRLKQRRRERRIKRIIFAAGGWAVMAWMVYLMIVTTRSIPKMWDPWEILDISRSADEKQIKSRYRKLSLILHPDKVKIDPSKNMTLQMANDHWVDVTKAFKALTDEEIRNNYDKYGHPDGKQSLSIGIALPQFIVTEGNGKYVLLAYAALLGTLLPYFVGKWWYGTQRMTRDKILVSSAGNLFTKYKEDINAGDVIGILSSGEEFKEAMPGSKGEYGAGKVERRIFEEQEALSMTETDRSLIKNMEDSERRKALALLWAYLGRIGLEDSTLDEEKYEVAPIAFTLNESFTSITLGFGNLKPLLSSFRTAQSLIQAVPTSASPLLQLPNFTTALINRIEEKTSKSNMTVQAFMSMPDAARRSLVVGPSLLSETQYKSATQIASQMPAMQIARVFFKVTGERCITSSSLVQLVVKVRMIPPGTARIPELKALDLEDPDPKEGDLDALHGRKKKKVMNSDGKIVEEEVKKSEIQPPLAHAPYFARDHSPIWHMFLAENRSGKIAVPPTAITTFDKPLFDETGRPTCDIQTLKMQFQAPPQVGEYAFQMNLICDSYIGLDVSTPITLKVEEMSKAEEIEDEEEISEPEEDSIAGQMNSLRSDAPKKRKMKAPVMEDSDDSDTEGEAEANDSDTDTDTDTDEE